MPTNSAFGIQLPVVFSGANMPVISTLPSVLFGSSLLTWLNAGFGVTQASSVVSAITSANSNSPITLSQSTTANRPSYVASAANSLPGIQAPANQLLSGAPGALSFEYTQAFSLLIAFRFNSSGAGQPFRILFGSLDSSLRGWLFSTGVSKISLSLRGASSGIMQVTGTTTLVNGTLYIVTFTSDGSGQASGIKAYINGVAETLSTNSNTLATNSILGSSPLAYLLGQAAGNSSTDTFLEAYVVNHVLSTSERSASDTYLNGQYAAF
jgi:hypothetical protein